MYILGACELCLSIMLETNPDIAMLSSWAVFAFVFAVVVVVVVLLSIGILLKACKSSGRSVRQTK